MWWGERTRYVFLSLALAVPAGATVALADDSARGSRSGEAHAARSLTPAQIKRLIRKEAKKHRGPRGRRGPVGPAGAAGTNGTNGTNGTDGAQGPPGPSKITKVACKTNTGIQDPSCGTVFDQDGFRVQAACTANGFTARSSREGSVMTLFGGKPSGFVYDTITNSGVNAGFILSPSGSDVSSSGLVTYTPAGSSRVITMNFAATMVPGSPQGDCVFVAEILAN